MAESVARRLMTYAPRDAQGRGRLVVALAWGCATLVGVTLLCTQLAFFPIFSGSADAFFHSLLYFVPFAAVALYVDLPLYLGLAGAMGVALAAHARLMPIDYYEMMFQSPLVALTFSCVGALVIWGALRLAVRLASHDPNATHVRRRTIMALLLLAASALLSFLFSPFLAFVSYGDHGFDALGLFFAPSVLVGNLSFAALWYQVLFDWLFWAVAALLADVALGRALRNEFDRSLRSVFRRWLLLVVASAFLVTISIAYCLETADAISGADALLQSHLDYLCEQVQDYASRQETLKRGEDDLVLSKGHAVARLLEVDPSILLSQDRVEELRDALDLASLTVCDGEGLVVADSDGLGIGSYNFASNEATAAYGALLDGTKGYLIEEPRNSVDEQGQTRNVRVFAGVRRVDAPGFVQVSIEAQRYQAALAAASIDHLAENYTFGASGVVSVARDGTILTSNDSEEVGITLVEEFGLGDLSEEGQELMLDELFSGKTQILQNDDDMSRVYLRGRQFGRYAVFVLTTDADVFAARTSTILLNSVFYLALFAAVFALANVLLDNVVVRGFVRTNDVLALITDGDLDQRLEERQTLEFESLSDGINATVGALKDSIAEAESRYDRELATAKAIQESALPSTFPPFPEVEAFDIHASMNAAKEVGGDFYDFFLIDEHTLGFLIADVSGKGIPASLFMMTAKTQLENYMSAGMPLAEAIQTANHHLCQGNDAGMFVTVWAATLDWETGELTYVNAGHNPPLLRHEGSWQWLTKKCGLFLGTFETAKYRQASLVLESGDELFLYTDGVNEAFSAAEEEFGNGRLEALLARHASDHPRTLIEAVRAELARWAEGAEQSDDITMLSIEYGVAPEVMASLVVPARLDQLERVMGFVHAELGRRLCPIGVQNKLDIALEEMFVNVCNYAYANREGPGTVKVSYVYTPNPASMTLELDDTGVPFDPLTRSDPTLPDRVEDIPVGGLGIMMTKRCVDDISYVRAGDHNVLAFTKRW